MFIPEDEAQRRIKSPDNLVSRIPPTDSPVPVPVIPPAPFDISSLLEPTSEELSAKALDKLLNPDLSGYKGRGPRGLTTTEQAGIGLTASYLGTTKASRIGGVAISTAHSEERGYTGPVQLTDPSKPPKQALVEKILEGHNLVVDKCFSRLLKTLDILDDEKLEGMKKPIEISQVARNLSGVIAQATQATQDRISETRENNVHFHIMRPAISEDKPEEYPVIDVSKVGVVS